MYKLLVVDDEENIRRLVRKYAEFEGHAVDEAKDGMEAIAMCRDNRYDLLVVDIMMPELDGFSACREIRKTSDVPIILLSARGEEYDRINGFEIGVDDYVVKPFSPKELMLRIDAIMKRVSPSEDAEKEVLRARGVTADVSARKVFIDGEAVNMTPKEYDLLFYLMRNKNIALSREKIVTGVWGWDYYGDYRTLDTHIKLLRKSLGEYSKYIVTLRGVGYRFDENE
ncbi:MAG: response regulator transcription factor [Clostridia bacterium]|nr:response regulator transcription factor [Clostridia bacterium]